MLNDRRLKVLRAIVTDYVSMHEPVGSKALVERHSLDVSPATVRNDMAALEEEGYLAQPHTSAGRIPTDKGYRLFVDKLADIKPLSPAERKAIETFMAGSADIDDIVHRTVRLLAQFTRQVAIVQYPISDQATVRHIEFVQLSTSKVMVILIDSVGIVEQRMVQASTAPEDLEELRKVFNKLSADQSLDQAAAALSEHELYEKDEVFAALTDAVVDIAQSNPNSEVVVAGFPNLTRYGADYMPMMVQVIEALEEQVVLLKLLSETATEPGQVAVRIGQENSYEPLQATSLVASSYGSPADAYARLGVVGPTRMDYPSAMAAVRAVANYVGRFLSEG